MLRYQGPEPKWKNVLYFLFLGDCLHASMVWVLTQCSYNEKRTMCLRKKLISHSLNVSYPASKHRLFQAPYKKFTYNPWSSGPFSAPLRKYLFLSATVCTFSLKASLKIWCQGNVAVVVSFIMEFLNQNNVLFPVENRGFNRKDRE